MSSFYHIFRFSTIAKQEFSYKPVYKQNTINMAQGQRFF